MDVTHQTDDEQATLWNGTAGRAWVEAQEVIEQMFKPFEHLLVEAVSAGSGGHVLDVGCGTGSTTRAVARVFGGNGRCTGIDISDPMIAAARARAERENVGRILDDADAQTRQRVIETVRGSFDAYVHGSEVRFTAACWMVGARASATPTRWQSDTSGVAKLPRGRDARHVSGEEGTYSWPNCAANTSRCVSSYPQFDRPLIPEPVISSRESARHDRAVPAMSLRYAPGSSVRVLPV